MKIITLVLLFTLSNNLLAKANNSDFFTLNDIFLGAGTLTQFAGDIQTDELGSTNTFEFLPYVTLGIELQIQDSFTFNPELAVSFPRSGRDENINKLTYWAQFPIAYKYELLKFSIGPGLLYNRISSSGETETLSNGVGTTDFPLPNGSSISSNLTLNFGIDWEFYTNISVKTEAWVINLTDSESRSLNYALSGYYHFGDIK